MPRLSNRWGCLPARESRPLGGKATRRGFTLVEMLVVIAIIGILAALITAAAANALWSAKQTKIKVEVDILAGAMESFKQKYGSYPPANLTVHRIATATMQPIAQLLAFVSRAFPALCTRRNRATLVANQIAATCSNAGVDTSELNPQVALVFWLSGFGPDPTDPFNRNNVAVTRYVRFSPSNQARSWPGHLRQPDRVAGLRRAVEHRNALHSRSRRQRQSGPRQRRQPAIRLPRDRANGLQRSLRQRGLLLFRLSVVRHAQHCAGSLGALGQAARQQPKQHGHRLWKYQSTGPRISTACPCL